MPGIKVTFPNAQGDMLAASLEMPDRTPKFYAIFAHCFTCSKDVIAASRISRKLCDNGVAVLRFDFTGLGNSDGDFSNTNFSSNIQDIISAVEYLEENHGSTKVLIGHSLGGAAVLAAAQSLNNISAVVRIAAPAIASHIEHLYSDDIDVIQNDNEAEVDIADRKFNIKKQFVIDVAKFNSIEHISNLNKALLIFHSPMDTVVPIGDAAKIYSAAKHPKSFISLDKADHLLPDPQDAIYIADVMVSWISRYFNEIEPLISTPPVESVHV
jgi:alpha/beta superfamily hydrolase